MATEPTPCDPNCLACANWRLMHVPAPHVTVERLTGVTEKLLGPHVHGAWCINTYPDCDYPGDPEDTCSLPECDQPTVRPGQPCDPCHDELGTGA